MSPDGLIIEVYTSFDVMVSMRDHGYGEYPTIQAVTKDTGWHEPEFSVCDYDGPVALEYEATPAQRERALSAMEHKGHFEIRWVPDGE